MPSRRRSSAVAFAVAAAVLATSLTSDAADVVITTVDAGATATEGATPVEIPFDAVSIYQTGALTTTVRDAALAAAKDAGAVATTGRGFSGLLKRVRRGGTVIQQASGTGWAFPMAITALPPEAIASVMGRDASGAVLTAPTAAGMAGRVIMGQTTAELRGAQVGDILEFVGPSGSTVSFEIGRIGTDEEVGGTEVVMTTAMAAKMGGTIDTRVLVYGLFDRAKLTSALKRRGLCNTTATDPVVCVPNDTRIRVRRSWDPPDPDDTLGLAATKSQLGEFDFYYAGLSTTGWTSMNATWVANYLLPKKTYPTGIKARCNTMVDADLTAALEEVRTTYPSLVGAYTGIDVTNTNSYGGCGTGQVRFSRLTQALGSVSRHSWGQPIDMSTTANCQGCVPKMDCRIVRIFRKHNFAWGGNFLTPDGMHFEWVGTQRNALSYPSRYCPNLSGGRIQVFGGPAPSTGPAAPSGRAVLFVDDGVTNE